MRYKSLHKTLRFGEDLAAAQQEMLAKNLAKAALAKAREDERLKPARIRRIRQLERKRYALHKAEDIAAEKIAKLALKEEKRQKREARKAEKAAALANVQNQVFFRAYHLTHPEAQAAYVQLRNIWGPISIGLLVDAGVISEASREAALKAIGTRQ